MRIYPRTEALQRELEWLRNELPDGEISYQSGTEDESAQIVVVGSDTNPGAVYIYDRAEKTLDKLYDSRPDLPSDHLCSHAGHSLRSAGRRGDSRVSRHTEGTPARDLPTVILPHGGPWGRDYWGYDPFVQFPRQPGATP